MYSSAFACAKLKVVVDSPQLESLWFLIVIDGMTSPVSVRPAVGETFATLLNKEVTHVLGIEMAGMMSLRTRGQLLSIL